MVFDSDFEGDKSNASLEAAYEKKLIVSKTSLRSKISDDADIKDVKSTDLSFYEGSESVKTTVDWTKTAEDDSAERFKSHLTQPGFTKFMRAKILEKCGMDKSETNFSMKDSYLEKDGQQQDLEKDFFGENDDSLTLKTESGVLGSSKEHSHHKDSGCWDSMNSSHSDDTRKSKGSGSKKPTEIPKFKPLAKLAALGSTFKFGSSPSKLPVKNTKYMDDKLSDSVTGLGAGSKGKIDYAKVAVKPFKWKRESKIDEKLKEALKEKFGSLVPIYESELQKIREVWVNTIYCSLTMRTNLVKLLFHAFPSINRSQIQMENEKLLRCIAHAKSNTKTEADSLIQFVRSLLASQEKIKDQYRRVSANREIAEVYNYDWRKLTKRITDIGQEAKQLELETPELLKKKEINELAQREKIRNFELSLANKDEELKRLMSQLTMLKQKESSYKGNVLLKIQDYKGIREDIDSLKSTEKQFQELKAKFLYQNETYERKIKDMESTLEEKRKLLDKEKEIKMEMQAFLSQMETQQKLLTSSVGKEQVEYVLGGSQVGRDKRRQQLWVAAVKLVLRGFLIQMKRLEKDRNKMLLELQSNDSENLNSIATTIIRKDNFIKSVKHQMNDFQKASKYSKNPDNPCKD